MQLLEQRIKKDGKVLPGDILVVGSFLNQQIDCSLINEMGADFAKHFASAGVTKVLTIEASGIALAAMAAYHLGCNMVFAKKHKSANMTGDTYVAEVRSYTKNTVNQITVSKKYLLPTDKVLIIDDFLATGSALEGLISLTEQSGATIVGCGIAIEKCYQGGGDSVRKKGIEVYSQAMVENMDNNIVSFRTQAK